MRGREKGFTLVELVIVLVIIGIILGAVLKGQELINNAKAKRVLNDMRGFAALAYTFYDRYGRFPGDCNNDGIIDYTTLTATPASFSATTGSFCYNPSTPSANNSPDPQWQELLQAQLVSGNARDLAKHIYSGAIYFAGPAVGGQNYNVIVVRQIPCYVAKIIDQSIDGTLDAGLGAIREISGGAIRTASDNWTTCTSENTNVDIVYFFDRRPN